MEALLESNLEDCVGGFSLLGLVAQLGEINIGEVNILTR